MKTGKSLTELAAEVERQAQAKRDFVADTRKVEMVPIAVNPENAAIRFEGLDEPEFPLNDLAHRQLATRLKIPQKYYDRMRTEAPGLLRYNVNDWFNREPQKRLFRTLDGRVRAFVSDRYNPLDYFDMMKAVLPMMQEMSLQVMSAEITEKRLYLKAVNIQAKPLSRWTRGDGTGPHDLKETYQPGIVIGNSEVGCGSVFVSPGIVTVECTNLAVWQKEGLRRYHVGRRMAE